MMSALRKPLTKLPKYAILFGKKDLQRSMHHFMKATKMNMSKIVLLHHVKLGFRAVLFLSALTVYIINRIKGTGEIFGGFEKNSLLLGAIWFVFFIEMLLRLFPSNAESMGCQKQFAKNYIKKPEAELCPRLESWKTTFAVATAWILLNGLIGVAYLLGLLDAGIMLLVALFYSVCDIICILYFCPFQTWFMKNKCCATCRIYNWDYAMMFTSLVFVPNAYAWSLLLIALVILLKWEMTVRKFPERFLEEANASLSCAVCQEKLCRHKKQLQGFLRKGNFNLKGNILFRQERKNKEN